MNIMLLTTAVFALVTVLAALGARQCLASTRNEGLGIILAIVSFLCLIVTVCFPSVTYGEQAYGRSECSAYSRDTGYQTKFVVYTSFDTGHCLVRGAGGKWVSKDNLRVVVHP